jgi:O-antigen/teichoic acid export membrane protein
MVTVPANVWRGGFLRRAVILGGATSVVLAALAWIDSGMLLSAVIVFVVVALLYGIWLPRRMARFWPGAQQISSDDRVTVVRTARGGERIGDPRLAQSVIDYNVGMHEAAEQMRPFRWVLPLVLVVGVATTAWDALYGAWGNAIASLIYLVALLVEMFWWPTRRDRLLANGDRASEAARLILANHGTNPSAQA